MNDAEVILMNKAQREKSIKIFTIITIILFIISLLPSLIR